MNTSINRAAVFAVFELADNSSVSFTEKLMKLGIGDRATAKPLAMEWASKKYKARIEAGQRGDKLPTNSAAERAMYRVLDVCFPKHDLPTKTKGPRQNQSDPADKLFAAWCKLSAAQKRKFATLQLTA